MIDFTPKEYKIFDQSVSIPKSTPKWIDLGLPSRTLWKSTNEIGGLYDIRESEILFKNQMPTLDDWKELLNNTQQKWDPERKGYTVFNKYGSFFLPAEGCYDPEENYLKALGFGYYLTSTLFIDGKTCMWEGFNSKNRFTKSWGFNHHKYSVRLILR